MSETDPLRTMKNLLSLLAALLLLSSCYHEYAPPEVAMPEKLIGHDTMVLIIVDVEIAEAALRHKQNFGYEIDDKNEYYFHSIFEKYGISKGQFDSSLAYYKTDLEVMNDIYEDVITKLSLIQSEAEME